ncbi:universal stress protein [Microbacterium hatanonis]|uniref:Universal stress protein n=1 Tax=Microbacterium hatanonis TaxID=404366 RepID=A0A5C8I3X4_9MICO|nr:universal stress protein [Microbacterium hatanonis]TXK12655.1 universal stress protein [Microbacterium hatanonis]
MNETIVVGVADRVADSDAGRRAVTWAIDRAVRSGSALRLVTVVGGTLGVIGEGEVLERAMEQAGARLERYANEAHAQGAAASALVYQGRPVERLVEASVSARLLVIASDYRGPTSSVRRGPHGVRIAAGAHCPVVVVPDIDLSEREGVVVGADGSDLSEAAIAFAAAEADRDGHTLTAVTTWTPVPLSVEFDGYPDGYFDNLQALAEEAQAISLAGIPEDYPDLRVVRVVERGDAADVLNRFALHARLVVVGTHGRGAIARFLLGSTSHEMLAAPATVTAVIR